MNLAIANIFTSAYDMEFKFQMIQWLKQYDFINILDNGSYDIQSGSTLEFMMKTLEDYQQKKVNKVIGLCHTGYTVSQFFLQHRTDPSLIYLYSNKNVSPTNQDIFAAGSENSMEDLKKNIAIWLNLE